ncbi:pilus assembly protein [Marinobacter shengliensis]|uniref:pilus assembly protein n=1 Tax=Marinobacter shengliensis TaxID=1389223 RepID=UPI00148627C9|nr:PilC/PilY family type IV pilus protein [Marinobacter shengliensis]
MKMKNLFQQTIQACLVALFVGWPVAGWSTTVGDRPLFIDAAVDHNLMFVVDDSGSMDFEVLAPAVGVASEEVESYIFNPGKETGSYPNANYVTGKTILGSAYFRDFTRQYYYLRSADYNLQFYDPSAEYSPWPSTSTNSFGDADPENAMLDPGLSSSDTVDLQESGELGLTDSIPATFFVTNQSTIVERTSILVYGSCRNGWEIDPDDEGQCRSRRFWWNPWSYEERPSSVDNTIVAQNCSEISSNWYEDWHTERGTYRFKDSAGVIQSDGLYGFAPDGACIQKVELSSGNGDLVEAVTGKTLEFHLQNFANWFQYYRRRHHAIRGAIAESVTGLERMNLGVFWINNRRDMANKLYSTETGLNTFLDEHYDRFGGGTWGGGGTPNRRALQHAGREFAKTSVRGNLECRKNFTLLFTDGYSNNHPSSTDAGNADSSAGAPFQNSTHSNTLGDIAYYYYQGLRNNGNIISGGAMRLPVQCGTDAEKPWMDCNTDFHMNTYTVALGMEGQNFAGRGYSKVIDAHNNPPNWGSSSIGGSDNAAQIDDLYHAAVNGKGEYYDARSTTALIAALKSAINDVQQQVGSGSNLSFNTTSLRSGGFIYAAEFMSQSWTGTIRAGAIDQNGRITNWVWDAAVELNARDLEQDPRLVITYNGGGVEFDWDNLSNAQKDDLRDGDPDAVALARMEFIKGFEVAGSNGVTFRTRESKLGAIVNSSPAYVGEPSMVWPDQARFGDEPYSEFRADKKSRQKVVYIGANDGMLHGFDAGTGEEVLAYIPGFLYSSSEDKGLSPLTDPNAEYRSYVDLPLNTVDVFVDGEWRSVLIGGSRGATPGIFALDVTDPANFSAGNAGDIVLWEFSGNNNLGNLVDAVQIVLLDWGTGDYRWSAVFSNGYGAPSGKNGLFILDIEDPSNAEFIEVADGAGLSPARIVDHLDASGNPNSDGVADRAYAGDLEGRLWAIDLTGGKDSWGVAYGGEPLFVATDNLNRAQPISSQPDIARNNFKTDLGDPNLLVFFGTGKYLEAGDIPQAEDASDALPQSFYGISDRGAWKDGADNRLTRASLTNRVVTTGSVTVDGEPRPVRKTDGDELEWSTQFGWYVDLPAGGERVVEPPRVRGEYIVFASTIPTGGDPCGGGGSSFLTALQLDGSTDPNKAIIDVNNDGKLDSADEGWAGFFYGDGLITSFALIDNLVITSDSGARKQSTLTNFGSGLNASGRIGWSEIVDL